MKTTMETGQAGQGSDQYYGKSTKASKTIGIGKTMGSGGKIANMGKGGKSRTGMGKSKGMSGGGHMGKCK